MCKISYMNNLSDRIKSSRKLAKLTQEKLANDVGVSRVAITQWESGETKSIEAVNLIRAAKAMNVNPEWLATGEGEPLNKPIKYNNMSIPNTVEAPRLTSHIPLISWVQAGQWSDIYDNFQPGDADEWIPLYGLNVGPHSYALVVVGDSMSPTLSEGDKIIVDATRQPENGQIIIVRRNDTSDATVKRYRLDGADKLLVPDNQRYEIIKINNDHEYIFCGVVVEKMTRLV